MNDTNVDSMFDSKRKGISGSKFTVAFVILLVAGVIFGFLTVIRFQKIMTAFDDVRLKWPAAAASIDEQIKLIDAMISKAKSSEANTSETKIDDDLKGWNQAVINFREYSQYDRQVVTLEALLKEWRNIQAKTLGGVELVFPERTKSIQEFVLADSSVEALQADGLGKICQALFGLNLSSRVFKRL